MYGIEFSIIFVLALLGLLVIAHLREHRNRHVITCPVCNGRGDIPVSHPSGDPQLDSERECPACLGDELQELDAFGTTAADMLADRIERALQSLGLEVIVSHYPRLEPKRRWEIGALKPNGRWAGHVTGESRLTAMHKLARQHGVDVRRIPA